MDTLGVIDLSEGTVWITSALYDSALLQTLHLSGEMALYARFTNDPFFLLSVGGYHPALPAAGRAARRDLRPRPHARRDRDLRRRLFSLEAYFAVTSNTLQFGSHASLEASSKFLGVTYTARGEVGFDVLLVFSPFSFVGRLRGVGRGHGGLGRPRAARRLAVRPPRRARSRGPAAAMRASRSSASTSASRSTSAATRRPRRRRRENVLELVADGARAEPPAWRPVAPGGDATVLVAADDAADDEVWASPDADLEAVQDVAPLDRELDHYGAYEIAGPSDADDHRRRRRRRRRGARLDGGRRTTSRPRSTTT